MAGEAACTLNPFRTMGWKSIRVVLTQCLHWSDALATERKDHRYYELVEDTMHPEIRGTRAEQSELEFGRGQLLLLFLRPRHYLVLNFRDPARP